MKPQHWIPPITALLFFAVWNTLQQQSISKSMARTAELEQTIAQASRSGISSSRDVQPRKRNQLANSGEPIDWKTLSDSLSLVSFENGIEDIATEIYLKQRLLGFSVDDFDAALEEIDALDLSKSQQIALKQVILETYIARFPQAALNRFIGDYSEFHFRSQERLQNAFRDWVKGDQVAAARWFDQKIAEGKLDQRSSFEMDGKSKLESLLFSHLLESDPSAAIAWTQHLETDEKFKLLGNTPLPSSDQMDYLSMMRVIFESPTEQARALSIIAANLTRVWGLDSVDVLLENSDFGTLEIDSIVRKSMGSKVASLYLSPEENFAEIADWGAKHSPQVAADVLGSSLANVASQENRSFQETAQMILNYEGSLSRDLLLESLVKYNQNATPDEVADLIGHISDPQLRAKLMQNQN